MKITCNTKIIDLSIPKVMGILNITPDSFYDGGKFKSDKSILKQIEKMLKQGATFIDVGAYSSRPNAIHITEEEELRRIVPIIDLLVNEFPEIILSIDTFRSKVASTCIESGASIINDISGGSLDNKMFVTIAKYQAPYILMHLKGTPQNMQENPFYNDIISEITTYFETKIKQLHKLKVRDIIIDLGFGFGKTIEHNYKILNELGEFKKLGLPLLAGMSRKSMLYKILDSKPSKMKNATSIVNTIALQNGAKILRVHDVKEAMECIKITNYLNKV